MWLCGIVVIVTMELKQCVLGFFLLITFGCVFSFRPKARSFRPRVTMTDQTVGSHFGGQRDTLQSHHEVQSLMPELIPLALDVAPSSVQSKQEMESPVDGHLTWKFPTTPEKPAQPDINFELPQPHVSNSIAVQCLESGVHVEVKQDFFVSGHLLEPTFFSLGGCGVVDVDTAARVLIFQSALQECGSQLTVTEDELVYVFAINYKPAALQNIPIVRSIEASVGIECHYPRKQNVSSNALQPAWIPYASTVVAEDVLVFSLKLMTDDWMYERPSNVFYLGDIFNIQASLKQYNHVPLRIFVDYCVATATPDVNSAPMYSFIENHGCLTDAKYTGSVSKFLPRVQDDKLQFQLESFRFQQETSGSHIYITCLLKGIIIAQSHIDEEHKSCSYLTNGWVSADGSDQACACCDTSCGTRTDHVFPASLGIHDVGRVQVGPLQIWDDKHSTKSVA